MTITLSEESHKRALDSIITYFDEQLEQEIGVLQAQLLLDFFLEELAPSVYNKAVYDAQTFIHGQVADIDTTCFEPEFEYWKKKRK